MLLKEYLEKNDITNQEFAEKLEVHESTVSHYVTGRRKPRWDIIRRIYSLTRGQVDATDWMLAERFSPEDNAAP